MFVHVVLLGSAAQIPYINEFTPEKEFIYRYISICSLFRLLTLLSTISSILVNTLDDGVGVKWVGGRFHGNGSIKTQTIYGLLRFRRRLEPRVKVRRQDNQSVLDPTGCD